MSVKVHEPVCEDSAQDLYFWFDHFLGDQIKDEWRAAGTGSVAVVDQQTGGIAQITTGALTGNSYYIDWNDIRSLHVDQKVTMEARAKFSDDDSDIQGYFGLLHDSNDLIVFFWEDGEANIQYFCENDGARTKNDSGIARDTSNHIYRIECLPTGEVHFYIDGVECANSPITTNIPDDATDFLQPHFRLWTRVDSAKSLDIDYVVVRQER